VHYQSLGHGAEDESTEKRCLKMEWEARPRHDRQRASSKVARPQARRLRSSFNRGSAARDVHLHPRRFASVTVSDIARFEWHQKILYGWMLRTRDEANQIDSARTVPNGRRYRPVSSRCCSTRSARRVRMGARCVS
jgi:hypothetical protein